MSKRLAIAIVILLLPCGAAASTVFLTGFEQCRGDSQGAFWSGSSGSPTISTGWNSSSTGSFCSLQINPARHTAEYYSYDLSTTYGKLYQSLILKFDQWPAECVGGSRNGLHCAGASDCPLGTCTPDRCPVFSFLNSATGKVGAMVMVEADGAQFTSGRLSAYYEDDGKECSASTNDGTECTDVSTCVGTFEGEASCSLGKYATVGGLATGTEYLVTLEQDNTVTGAGNVKVSLWVGTSGNAISVGSQIRPQGKCAATGDHPSYACASDSDCGTSTPCSTGDVVAIDRLVFGSNDTGCPQFAVWIDDAWTNDTVATPNFAVRTLYPNADGSTNNWTQTGCTGNHYACVDETGVPDDTSTRLSTTTALDTEEFLMQDVTLGSGESLVQTAATMTVVGMRGANPGDKVVDLRLTDGTSTDSSYSDFDMDAGFSDNGWYVLPPFIATTAPDGTSWDITDLANVRTQVFRVSPASKATKITKVTLDVPVRLTDPTPPNVLSDLNGDGSETVCIVGDSTWNDSDMHDELVASILEPDNLLNCAAGGATVGGILNSIHTYLDGDASVCAILRGSNAPCDYAFVDAGVNDFFSGIVPIPQPTPVGEDTTFPQWRDWGYCDDDGGADEGNFCHCNNQDVGPEAGLRCHSLVDNTFFSYSTGHSWKSTCTTSCVNQTVPTKICVDHPDEACNSSADCSTGSCSFTAYSTERCTAQSGTRRVPQVFCVDGCLNADNCSNGLCVYSPPQVAVRGHIADIYAAALTRTCTTGSCASGTSKVNLILSAVPTASRTWPTQNVQCVQHFRRTIESYAQWIRRYAIAKGIDYIDLNAYFDLNCPDQDWDNCMRDSIHWTSASNPGNGPPYGQDLSAELITACITNGSDNLTTHDGVCTTGTCTAGKIGDTCSTDADCDLWSCTF